MTAPAAYQREWKRRNPERRVANARRFRFGTDGLATIERLMAEQDGKCAICGKAETATWAHLSVDHDHTCCPGKVNGKVVKTCGRCIRGLLCNRCNIIVGAIEDPKYQAALDYIERTSMRP